VEKAIGELSTEEFEALIISTIDKRFEAWLTQLLDALTSLPEEDTAELRPAFAASLRLALEQARSGQGVDLQSFRAQLGQ
jgi:hypothetical protein